MDAILHAFVLRDILSQSPIYRYYPCIYTATWCGYQYLFCLVRINAHRKENTCFSFQQPHWAFTLLSFLSLNSYDPLSTCLFFSLSLIHKYNLYSLPLISSSSPSPFLPFYSCLSLFLSLPLAPQPQMCSISTQKRVPLPGSNKQLFAVWNNKDCHHGYSSIPWALSGPFRVLKGAIIWWHQRQATT